MALTESLRLLAWRGQVLADVAQICLLLEGNADPSHMSAEFLLFSNGISILAA